MLLALKLLLVPALVGSVTLAARRWGVRVGGFLTALPLVAGPTLCFYALEQGLPFAADAARAAMLGIAGIAAFSLAYAWSAVRSGWPVSLVAGIGGFLVLGAGVYWIDLGGVGELLIANAALLVAHRLLPRQGTVTATLPPPVWDVPLRMIAAATVVLILTAVARAVGSTISGVLSAFPTVTLVLAAFIHVQRGHAAVAAFLRGVLRGLHGFALFCIVFSAALGPLGWTLVQGLAVALLAQLALQTILLRALSTPTAEAPTETVTGEARITSDL